jgi:hypothetical protein
MPTFREMILTALADHLRKVPRLPVLPERIPPSWLRYWDRNRDLMIINRLLYQLSYNNTRIS